MGRLSFAGRMANIGSEVERSIKWKEKNDKSRFENAFERMLELIDLTLADKKNAGRLKEVPRARETLVDFLLYGNEYNSTSSFFRNYFLQFAYLARRGK